jgi:hypothetical protein
MCISFNKLTLVLAVPLLAHNNPYLHILYATGGGGYCITLYKSVLDSACYIYSVGVILVFKKIQLGDGETLILFVVPFWGTEGSVNRVSHDFFRYVNRDHSFFRVHKMENSAAIIVQGFIRVNETEFFS